MIEALPYPEESKRLEAVRVMQLLDTPLEERFEHITRMVCKLLNSLINEADTALYKAKRAGRNRFEFA
jgi:hypothetical protein